MPPIRPGGGRGAARRRTPRHRAALAGRGHRSGGADPRVRGAARRCSTRRGGRRTAPGPSPGPRGPSPGGPLVVDPAGAALGRHGGHASGPHRDGRRAGCRHAPGRPHAGTPCSRAGARRDGDAGRAVHHLAPGAAARPDGPTLDPPRRRLTTVLGRRGTPSAGATLLGGAFRPWTDRRVRPAGPVGAGWGARLRRRAHRLASATAGGGGRSRAAGPARVRTRGGCCPAFGGIRPAAGWLDPLGDDRAGHADVRAGAGRPIRPARTREAAVPAAAVPPLRAAQRRRPARRRHPHAPAEHAGSATPAGRDLAAEPFHRPPVRRRLRGPRGLRDPRRAGTTRRPVDPDRGRRGADMGVAALGRRPWTCSPSRSGGTFGWCPSPLA